MDFFGFFSLYIFVCVYFFKIFLSFFLESAQHPECGMTQFGCLFGKRVLGPTMFPPRHNIWVMGSDLPPGPEAWQSDFHPEGSVSLSFCLCPCLRQWAGKRKRDRYPHSQLQVCSVSVFVSEATCTCCALMPADHCDL